MQLWTSVERVVSRDNTRIDTVNTHNRRSSGYSHKCNYCNSSVLNFCHDLKCYLTNWLSDNKMSPTEEFTVFGFKSPIFGLAVWYPLEHHSSITYNIHSVHAAWELIYMLCHTEFYDLIGFTTVLVRAAYLNPKETFYFMVLLNLMHSLRGV